MSNDQQVSVASRELARCETCRFWEKCAPDPEDPEGCDAACGLGVCRAHPPTVNPDKEPIHIYSEPVPHTHGVWPSTYQDDWCGEHQPHPQPQQTQLVTDWTIEAVLAMGGCNNSTRISNALAHKVKKVSDLRGRTWGELLKIRSFGMTCARQLQRAIEDAGYSAHPVDKVLPVLNDHPQQEQTP